jgi:hypothetical protein
MSTRDRYVFDYANYLHSDSALWQLTVTYMYSCGEIGAKSADEVLLRVPLRLVNESSSSGEPRIDAQTRAGEVTGVLKAVNESCLEFQREHVRRTVCKVGYLSIFCPAFNMIALDCRPDFHSRERIWTRRLLLHFGRRLVGTRSCH